MGEILRAVCDETCVYSQPAFYVGRVTQFATLGGTRLQVRRQAYIQCKNDTWFLMMGWSQSIAIGAATPPYFDTKTDPVAFSVQDGRSGESYSTGQLLHSNAGFNLNNIITLPEYVLWSPASLIVFSMDVPSQNTDAAVNDDTWVTLSGIEYLMPTGKG